MKSSSLFPYVVLLCLSSCVSWSTGQLACSPEGAIRLVGGRHLLEGRLEVCLYNSIARRDVWGTVCSNNWDIQDTMVACRQLGVSENSNEIVDDTVFFDGARRNDGTPYHWQATHCTGNESHLVNCSRTPGICDLKYDIGLVCSQPVSECTNGNVRIVNANGNSSTEGRVEFCVGGQWGSVCDTISAWDDNDAKVVCNQLGHSGTKVTPKALSSDDTPDAAPNVPIVLDVVQCVGNEASLADCLHAMHIVECVHRNDVGVNCTETAECFEEGGIRLVEGDGVTEGRIEYCHDELWGSVCRNSWDHRDAEVVCRQLGFVGVSVAETESLIRNNNHNDRVFVNRAMCVGNESRLSECPMGDNCVLGRHGAGVKCYNESNCDSPLSVRLSNGVLSDEMGTVEMCYGDWGFVCHDFWDDNDAAVVCRQLGLTGGIALRFGPFQSGSGGFLLDDVKCTGSEATLADCTHLGLGVDGCTRLRQAHKATVMCGTTLGSPMARCTEEDLNKTVATSNVSLQVGSFGVCEEYQYLSEACNSVFPNTSTFVFFNNSLLNQSVLSQRLDGILSDDLLMMNVNNDCAAMIRSVVCHYFFAPCGTSGAVHVPRGVCTEECTHVQNTCSLEWSRTNAVLRMHTNIGLTDINCTSTQSYLSPLPACCNGAGVEIPVSTTGVPPTTPSSTTSVGPTEGDPQPVIQVGTIAGIVIALVALVLILMIVVVLIIFCLVSAKRRKATIRTLQMDILSSPSTKALDPLSSPSYLDDDNGTDAAALKAHSNGSRRGPLAVPNPYSSKKELELQAPLLSPHQTNMMNRISSSIIRELTSNMLIPYTRLKLLDCVGQGEFGVVYKAHYTEPEGDIGYKTSTVAVKTLKGFFDQNQVNKIMEESIKMKSFDHPNVLNLVGVCLDAGPAPYVVMPYMANGSLLHHLKKERRNLVLPVGTDEDVKFDVCKRLVVMCMQVSCGMEYLAHEKFVHRDLAARNCMIDIHFVIKIADFGLSEDIYAKNYYRQSSKDKSAKLPVKWMAPESLSDGIFSEKSDVWSYGITCWEIFSGGKTPYPGVDPLSLSVMLESDKRLSKPLNSACPEEMYQVMKRCWAKSPEERPSFAELVENISEYTEKIAGYLDINNYNPFTATYEEIKPSQEDERTVTSPEQVLDQMKNKKHSPRPSPQNSPRSSPKPSPLASPQASPKRSPRASPRHSPAHSPHLSPFLGTPSTGIQIRIESPKEEENKF